MANERYLLQFSMAGLLLVAAVVPAAIAGLYWLLKSEDTSGYCIACTTGVIVGAVVVMTSPHVLSLSGRAGLVFAVAVFAVLLAGHFGSYLIGLFVGIGIAHWGPDILNWFLKIAARRQPG